MRRITLKAAMRQARRCTVAVALLLAGSLTLHADDSAFTSTASLDTAGGADIYTHICQGCHMAQAQGATGAGFYPKLAGDKKLVSWEFAALTVLAGRNGMPPFGLPADQVLETRSTHLSDAQVADVVNYIRTHFGNNYSSRITAKQVAGLPHPSNAAMDN